MTQTSWGRAPLQSEDYSSLSETQDKVLSLLPLLPSALSMWGSGNIIHMVLGSKKRTPYRRILFALSCCDLINSFAFVFQPFLIPRETSQRVWAIGKDATCTALGWFSQFHFSSMWYNGMLSIYFLLTIKFGMQENKLATRVEPFMHALSIGYPLITATIGAVVNMYHEILIGHGCWVYEYPEGCQDCAEFPDTQRPCCQGSFFGWIWAGFPTFIIFLVIIINNLVVYRHVRATIRTSQQYLKVALKRQSQQLAAQQCDQQAKRIQAVATQAFLYVGAFAVTYVPALALRIMESLNYNAEDEAKLFPALIVQALTLPLLGFCNCLIFVRPSYIRNRKIYPLESHFWAFTRSLHGDKIRPRNATLFSAQMHSNSNTNNHRPPLALIAEQDIPASMCDVPDSDEDELEISMHPSELCVLEQSSHNRQHRPDSAVIMYHHHSATNTNHAHDEPNNLHDSAVMIYHRSAPDALLEMDKSHLFEDVLFEDVFQSGNLSLSPTADKLDNTSKRQGGNNSELDRTRNALKHNLMLDQATCTEPTQQRAQSRLSLRRGHSSPNLNESVRNNSKAVFRRSVTIDNPHNSHPVDTGSASGIDNFVTASRNLPSADPSPSLLLFQDSNGDFEC